jgi:hypothetical protein
MKNLKKDTLVKVMMIFTGVLSFFELLAYTLLKHFLLETSIQTSFKQEQLLYEYNLVWIALLGLSIVLELVAFFTLRKYLAKLDDDVNAIKTYVKEISQKKNNDAIIKIKNYTDFLEISLILKNIVKRFKQKEKKLEKK